MDIHEFLTNAAVAAAKENIEISVEDSVHDAILTLCPPEAGNGLLGAFIFNEMTLETTSLMLQPLWLVQEFIDRVKYLGL